MYKRQLYILRESLQYLANERIVPPRYTTLQDMVGRVVTYERNRVADLLALALTPAVKQALDALLQADELSAAFWKSRKPGGLKVVFFLPRSSSTGFISMVF